MGGKIVSLQNQQSEKQINIYGKILSLSLDIHVYYFPNCHDLPQQITTQKKCWLEIRIWGNEYLT